MIINLLRTAVAGTLALLALLFCAFAAAVGGRIGLSAVVTTLLVGAIIAIRRLITLPATGPANASPTARRLVAVRRLTEGFLLVTAAGAAAGLLGLLASSKPPTQAALAAQFAKHRTEYEELRRMFLADELNWVGEGGARFSRTDGVPPSNAADAGIAADRALSYRELMTRADVDWIRRNPDGGVSGFYNAGWGFGGKGWAICFNWSPAEPKKVVPTLDGWRQRDTVWSPLGNGWYVEMKW